MKDLSPRCVPGRRQIGAAGATMVAAALCLVPSGAAAQVIDGNLTIPAALDIRGRGWEQLSNLGEMTEFLLAFAETIVLTALLAFHPVNIGFRERNWSFDLSISMFLFALIGMLTGFLVVHHGYLIGFVIFGIGGLFRFRMETSSAIDTSQMVIAALVGLAVGLDLPVMATVGMAATWIVLAVFGKSQTLALEVKFDEAAAPPDAILRLQEDLAAQGFRPLSVSKAKFKPTAHYVLSSRKRAAQVELVRALSELQARPESGVADWHIDRG